MTEPARISIDSEGRAVLGGALTLDTVAGIYQQAELAASRGRRLASLDLGGVSRVDSSGLALVLEWQSAARKAGHSLDIDNAPDNLLSLARLCEAADLLAINGRNGSGGRVEPPAGANP